MSALELVRTADGMVWERRAETRGGLALYAVQGAPKCCPPFVMATLEELAEHGIQSDELAAAVELMGALPMPAGSEPQSLPVDADRAKAPWGRGEDGRPLLPMGAHWTDVPELVDQYLAGIQARVDGAQSGNWYVASTVETWRAPGTVCTRVDGYNRTVGQFTNVSDADLELVLHAHGDLAWCLDLVAKLRARVAELEAQRQADHETWQHDLRTARDEREATAVRIAGLEAERHSTNESLSEAAEALRANRDRIMELERPAVERDRREVRESYRWLAAHAREDGDFEGEAVVVQQLAEREQLWRQEDKLAREFAADPLAAKPWEPGPSAEASADRLTALFAPTQALREDEPAEAGDR